MTAERPARGAEAARSESAAFEALFLEHWPRVYGVLVRLVGDPAEAEDLALETFWRLYQKAPDGRGPLGGWLYRVALNLGYNALRGARRRLNYEETAGREALARQADPGPETVVERAEERRQIRAVLAQLAPREAQLLTLRQAGCTYQEIGAALGVAPASVGTLLNRAEAEFERRWRLVEPSVTQGKKP